MVLKLVMNKVMTMKIVEFTSKGLPLAIKKNDFISVGAHSWQLTTQEETFETIVTKRFLWFTKTKFIYIPAIVITKTSVDLRTRHDVYSVDQTVEEVIRRINEA